MWAIPLIVGALIWEFWDAGVGWWILAAVVAWVAYRFVCPCWRHREPSQYRRAKRDINRHKREAEEQMADLVRRSKT
jgi:membrane protein implicated in regulation of membrane protease activity